MSIFSYFLPTLNPVCKIMHKIVNQFGIECQLLMFGGKELFIYNDRFIIHYRFSSNVF